VKKGRVNMNAIDLVYFAVVLIVGLVVFSNIDTGISPSIPTNSTPNNGLYAKAAQGNATFQTYQGLQTLSSAPVILAAVVILGIVGMLMHRS
jgi:hypothetical protein